MSLDQVLLAARDPEKLSRTWRLVREDSTVGYCEPKTFQQTVFQALADHKHVIVTKPRQSYTTTSAVIWAAAKTGFMPGIWGLILAEKDATAKEAMRRLQYGLDGLDPLMRPTISRRADHQIRYAHAGGVYAMTAGSEAPAIGHSPDIIVMTEYGEWVDQEMANTHIFPSFNKRPNARSIIESTAGKSGSLHEQLWLKSLEGQTRYHPVFLEWWTDPSYTNHDMVKAGWMPDEESFRYAEGKQGISIAHMAFRYDTINTEFNGDPLLYDAKYPPDPYRGFYSSTSPAMPYDAIEDMLAQAVDDPQEGTWGVCELEAPIPGVRYLIVADPNGYGEEGDPSAIEVFDCRTGREVAVWEGREDPGRLAERVERIQTRYSSASNLAVIVVESNKAQCIQTLKMMGVKGLYHNSSKHPGYYTTMLAKVRAWGMLVDSCRTGAMEFRSLKTLHQLRACPRPEEFKKAKRTGHHFDRAICSMIAAHLLTTRKWTSALERGDRVSVPGGATVSIKEWDALEYRKKMAGNSPWRD